MTVTFEGHEATTTFADFFTNDLPDESFDAVVCDPPYGISYKNEYSDEDPWDDFDDYSSFFSKYLKECYRLLRPGSSMWTFFAPTMIREVLRAIDESGFTPHLENWSVYARSKGRGANKKLKSVREDVVHLSKGPPKTWHAVEYLRRVVVPYVKDGKPRGWALDQTTGEPVRFTGLGNVMFFSPPFFHNTFEKQIHSAQKPVLLLSELVMTITDVGDRVLDPFAGSGSCAVASLLCNRDFVGYENSKDTYEASCEWLSNVDWSRANEYVKRRASSNEKKFKFGFDKRVVLPK